MIVALTAGGALLAQEPREGFRFRSGVELINVTATVTDSGGRFVRGLTREDFTILEDGRQQPITHFDAERVPVSLGIAIDTSGSMVGEKWDSAREALDRFLFELLDAEDEVFLYKFNDAPDLLQGWTTDRQRLSRALGRNLAEGWDGALRRGGGGRAPGPLRQAPEEGAARHLRRKRHQQHRRAQRSAEAGAGDRGAGLRDWHRRAGRNDVDEHATPLPGARARPDVSARIPGLAGVCPAIRPATRRGTRPTTRPSRSHRLAVAGAAGTVEATRG